MLLTTWIVSGIILNSIMINKSESEESTVIVIIAFAINMLFAPPILIANVYKKIVNQKNFVL